MFAPVRSSNRNITKTIRLHESDEQASKMLPGKRRRSNSSVTSPLAGDTLSQTSLAQENDNANNQSNHLYDSQNQPAPSSSAIPRQGNRKRRLLSLNSSVDHDSLPHQHDRQTSQDSDPVSLCIY
jgi:hypothetical protein